MDSPHTNKNLVGIVPVAGRKDKLNLPWSDCLQPLTDGLLAIEEQCMSVLMLGVNLFGLSVMMIHRRLRS